MVVKIKNLSWLNQWFSHDKLKKLGTKILGPLKTFLSEQQNHDTIRKVLGTLFAIGYALVLIKLVVISSQGESHLVLYDDSSTARSFLLKTFLAKLLPLHIAVSYMYRFYYDKKNWKAWWHNGSFPNRTLCGGYITKITLYVFGGLLILCCVIFCIFVVIFSLYQVFYWGFTEYTFFAIVLSGIIGYKIYRWFND